MFHLFAFSASRRVFHNNKLLLSVHLIFSKAISSSKEKGKENIKQIFSEGYLEKARTNNSFLFSGVLNIVGFYWKLKYSTSSTYGKTFCIFSYFLPSVEPNN